MNIIARIITVILALIIFCFSSRCADRGIKASKTDKQVKLILYLNDAVNFLIGAIIALAFVLH